MRTIISDFDRASDYCASEIIRLVSRKPDAVLAFSAEPCLFGVFDRLSVAFKNGEADFSDVKILSVTELVSSKVMAEILEERLLSRINIPAENRFLLSDAVFSAYDDIVSDLGGIDALFLGLGSRAQLGFNEAGTPFSSRTHISALSSFLKNDLAYLPSVSERGLTMGIYTITNAKNICIIAFGSDKADAVFKMLYGRTDPTVPAAFLQLPMNVTVLLDSDSSSEI